MHECEKMKWQFVQWSASLISIAVSPIVWPRCLLAVRQRGTLLEE